MDSSFLERLAQLETRFDKFSIVGTDDVLVAGNLKSGFTINIGIQGSGIKGGGGGGGGTGACCYNDGTCDNLTQADCESAGGTFQGLGTSCDTVSCTGACCEPGCVENTTIAGCAADGGIFQGFGRTCDPDPCPTLPPCACGFNAFDGSGRKFLTQTRTMFYAESDSASGFGDCTCNTEANATWTQQYNPDTCEISCSCSGSVNRHDDVHHINDCSDTLSNCSSGFDPYTGSVHDTIENIIGCTSLSCGSCCAYSLTPGSDTPTMRTFTFVGVGCCAASGTLTVTLSDECVPEFSPPP